jgi:hypothetical protein
MEKKPDILSDRDDCRIDVQPAAKEEPLEPAFVQALRQNERDQVVSHDVVVRTLRDRLAGGIEDDWEYVAERDDPWIDEALADVDAGNCVTHAEAKRYLEDVVREIELENQRASRAR